LDTIQELPETSFPIIQPNILHKVDMGIQPDTLYVDVGIQIKLDGLTVRKQNVGIGIYEAALPDNVTNNVTDQVNESIIKNY